MAPFREGGRKSGPRHLFIQSGLNFLQKFLRGLSSAQYCMLCDSEAKCIQALIEHNNVKRTNIPCNNKVKAGSILASLFQETTILLTTYSSGPSKNLCHPSMWKVHHCLLFCALACGSGMWPGASCDQERNLHCLFIRHKYHTRNEEGYFFSCR